LPSLNGLVTRSRCPILERAIRLGKSSRKGNRSETGVWILNGDFAGA
jgi:hypothetical protein